MVRFMRRLYFWWFVLIFAAIVLQLYLAGIGVFSFNGLTGFGPHFLVGDLIGIAILIGLGLAFAARLPRRNIGMSGALLVLMIIQFVLAHTGIAALSALHVVNGVLMFGLTGRIAWEARKLQMAEPAATTTPAPAAMR